jgi:hypothetical protein
LKELLNWWKWPDKVDLALGARGGNAAEDYECFLIAHLKVRKTAPSESSLPLTRSWLIAVKLECILYCAFMNPPRWGPFTNVRHASVLVNQKQGVLARPVPSFRATYTGRLRKATHCRETAASRLILVLPIIVTPTRPYRILAVVDWEQSGWLPEYWESRKAQYTADRADEWSLTYLPMIMEQFPSTWDPGDY